MEKPEKKEAQNAVAEKKEPEMMKFTDEFGNVSYFPKPPEPNIVDLLDQETWGSDEEEILPEEEEDEDAEDEEDEYELLPPDARREQSSQPPQKELTEEEMLEAAEQQRRRYEEEEERRKIERVKKKEEIIRKRLETWYEDQWNFPIDPEGWTEEDLGEEWADAPVGAHESGYDPDMVMPSGDEDIDTILAREKERMRKQQQEYRKALAKIKADAKRRAKNPSKEKENYDPNWEEKQKLSAKTDGPPVRPYYVPYRKHYPMIPKNHPEIECPLHVVEELEKIEEFLQWGSYIFADGSSYEGTLWDDLAHGKGVYTTPFELCKYEGEWFQNMMQGHGVLYVNVPIYQPPPDSELEKKMKAKGAIMKADFMSPEDREWLKKDIEDMLEKPDAVLKDPQFEDDPLWIEYFGSLPEKGRYKYSGQWKHNRMHGCGVYEVNTRLVYGKFYFGELLPDEEECTLEQSAMHSGLAEVAAAKAKMFTKKPDGMVREMDGPFSDPQHPYFYEEEDLWMAPGWVNAFHEVPDIWKRYVEEVDKEQEMWLNSFIKSPLRIPMPAELEYLWENGDEFLLLGNEPSMFLWLDEENLAKSDPKCEGEILYHVPTGQLINWITDKDGKPRFFWQPYKKDGSINPKEAIFLPDGWDEFFSDEIVDSEDQKSQQMSKEERIRKEREEDEQVLQNWEKDKEEMRRKWREEDEEFEEEMKLRAQIEEEEFQAHLRALDELEKQRKAAPPVKEEAKRAAADEGTVEEEVVEERPQPEQRAKDVEEEEEEEEEEDKKPRSFGKVAMLEQESKPNGSRPSQEATKFSFPTALASITMSMSPWIRSFSSSVFKTNRAKADDVKAQSIPKASQAVVAPEPIFVSFNSVKRKHAIRLVAMAANRGVCETRSGCKRLQRRVLKMKCSSEAPESGILSMGIPVY